MKWLKTSQERTQAVERLETSGTNAEERLEDSRDGPIGRTAGRYYLERSYEARRSRYGPKRLNGWTIKEGWRMEDRKEGFSGTWGCGAMVSLQALSRDEEKVHSFVGTGVSVAACLGAPLHCIGELPPAIGILVSHA